MARVDRRRGARAGAEIHRPRRPLRLRAQAPGRTLRRHEAARRHRARALDRAQDHADGRAVLRARRAHARHAAGRGAPHLPGDRADRVHDHPRRRRGDLSGRPHRADDQRPRRGACRDRRQSAAEGARPHRGAQAPALLRGAQPHHRFPGEPLQELRRGVRRRHDPRNVPVVRPGVGEPAVARRGQCRAAWPAMPAAARDASPRSRVRAAPQRVAHCACPDQAREGGAPPHADPLQVKANGCIIKPGEPP